MAATSDLIDFTIIESQKENIQALPSGRSAKALAQLYSPPLLGANPSPSGASDANLKAKSEFERELANIDEADDPLDIYDRYVKWTLDAYPSAQATPQSGLLTLLERATKAFQSSSNYKNDPRYMKLWLQYIQLFSDGPREVFAFLARHGIGEGLALYYEEFAAWLENAGRWSQAEEIYKMGIEREAHPVARLVRKFGEFERRKEAQPHDDAEPMSPALPTVRPALAAKLDPFSSASPSPAQQPSSTAGAKRSKGAKMAVFSDSSDQPRPGSNNSSKGWDSIGSLGERKKENSMEAKPWAGEKLKVGKTNGGMQKMAVFQDPSSNRTSISKRLSCLHSEKSLHRDQFVYNARTGKTECVFVNLEAIYPKVGDLSVEFSFEELRAMRRGLVDKTGKTIATKPLHIIQKKLPSDESPKEDTAIPTVQDSTTHLELPSRPKNKGEGFQIFQDVQTETMAKDCTQGRKILVESTSKVLALKGENDENSPPSRDEVELAKKAKREERANRTRKIKVMDVKHIKNETKTIQINMDSPTGPKIKRKKASDRAEPTMTINTKEAMDEIYGIFSQPLPSHTAQPGEAEDEDDSESDDDDDDDYTTGDESTATGKLSAPASEYGDETRNELLGGQKSSGEGRDDNTGWSDFTTSKHVPKPEEDMPEPPESTARDESDQPETEAMPEDLLTPVDEEGPNTGYVPTSPENFGVSVDHMRDTAYIPNHRLPFMTPIVEQTETSLDGCTNRTGKSFAGLKTPSRLAGTPAPLDDDDEPCSSPFQDVTADLDADKRRVLQPVRTKSTKGTISLGQGTAKSQIDAKVKDSGIPEPIQKGPIIKDEQCNPMDPHIRQTILSQMKPSLSSYDGYYEKLETTFGRAAEIKKYIRATSKTNRNGAHGEKSSTATPSPPALDLPGVETTYHIKRELGAGTFAPVYLVENEAVASLDAAEEAESETEAPNRTLARVGRTAHRRALEAIKMEEPPSTWEFHIIRQAHRRLGVGRAAESIVRAHEMHVFRDECYLVEEFRDQGTLLDVVNLARLDGSGANGGGCGGGGMEETMAMWLAVELLRTLEALHAKQLIHGDLKADNVLARFDDPGDETDWSSTFFASGAHGWASKGVCLIDFGRGIDMRQYVPNVGFIADWKTTVADCAEMRELRPWTYQIDYYGLAGTVHSLLFGKYMETVPEKTGPAGGLGQGAARTYRIRESLKRYWQTELWGELFHLLLNPLAHVEQEEGRKMPVLRGMKTCREKMESWLEENCERGIGLKGSISRMEAAIRERRRKSAKSG